MFGCVQRGAGKEQAWHAEERKKREKAAKKAKRKAKMAGGSKGKGGDLSKALSQDPSSGRYD